MKQTKKSVLLTILAAVILSGCASQAGNTLTPAHNTEQTGSVSAVKVECTAEASALMPKSLGFLETIPPTTYMSIYNAYAACAQKRGYETQCQSSDKYLCGVNIVGFQ